MSRLATHLIGIVLGLIGSVGTWVILPLDHSPVTENSTRTVGGAEPLTKEDLRGIRVLSKSVFVQCAIAILNGESTDLWWPSEPDLQEHPLLQNALFTHAIRNGKSEWLEIHFPFKEGNKIDLQSANCLLRTLKQDSGILSLIQSCTSLGSAANWHASILVAVDREYSTIFPIFNSVFDRELDLANETVTLLTTTSSGLNWALGSQETLEFVLKHSGVSEISDATTWNFSDSDVSVYPIEDYLASDATEFEKAQRVREWIKNMPLLQTFSNISTLLKACEEEPVFKEICLREIIKFLAISDIDYALSEGGRLVQEHGFTDVNVQQEVLRMLIDSDLFEASKRIAEMPQGSDRDKMIRALIDQGQLLPDEFEAWLDAFSDPELRKQYETHYRK